MSAPATPVKHIPTIQRLRTELSHLTDEHRLALALEAVRDTRDPFCRQQLARLEQLARHTRMDLEADRLRRAVG